MNKYISKYSKYETHFNRVDQWPSVQWAEDEPPLLLKIIAGAGVVLGLLLLMFI